MSGVIGWAAAVVLMLLVVLFGALTSLALFSVTSDASMRRAAKFFCLYGRYSRPCGPVGAAMSGGITGALLGRLRNRMVRIEAGRGPDQIIGTAEDPYLLRWFIIPRNRWFNIYYHVFCRSDDDRALHDHPWWNISLLLDGSYTEHTIAAGGVNRRTIRHQGALVLRGAKAAHRIELHAGPCRTLFITGPKIRDWGFHCPQGWRHWRIFTSNSGNVSSIGRGCGEEEPPRHPLRTIFAIPPEPVQQGQEADAVLDAYLAARTRPAPGKTELVAGLWIDFCDWGGNMRGNPPPLTRSAFRAALARRFTIIDLDGVDGAEGVVLREDRG